MITPAPLAVNECGGFQCRNGRCIHAGGQCNGTHDCGDGSDEVKAMCDGKLLTIAGACMDTSTASLIDKQIIIRMIG